jgi:hypothetical protein
MSSKKVLYSKVYAFLVCAMFIMQFIGILYTVYDEKEYSLLIYLSVLSVIFYFSLKYYLIPTFRDCSAIEITDDGIVDTMNKRTVFWDDVKNIRKVGLFNGGGVIIDVTNPKKYRKRSPWGYLAYYMHMLHFGSPIIIQTTWLNVSTDELFRDISTHSEKFFSAT